MQQPESFQVRTCDRHFQPAAARLIRDQAAMLPGSETGLPVMLNVVVKAAEIVMELSFGSTP
jgi:hypothetical protein